MSPRRPVRRRSYLLVYAVIAFVLVLAHGPLLDLPYYWDEAGQFIPAALDIYHSGALIPHSTVPNVHPPGLMTALAAAWHVAGLSIITTRVFMLLVAALGVLFAFLLAIELSRGAPGTPALMAAALLCACPLFFAQSMLAQLDMPAMALTALALLLFLQNRIRGSALACVALVLVKETGLAAVLVCAGWLIFEKRTREALWYLLPTAVLAAWLAGLRAATGHWLGNSEFADYNVFYSLEPLRLLTAILRRAYYLFAGSGHFIGTAAVAWAFGRMPLFRYRAWRVAGSFVLLHSLAVSALGGAVLERYLLPVLPVLYAAFALALLAIAERTRAYVVGSLFACLIAANFINPPYPFPFENNMQFVSFVDLEQAVAGTIERLPGTVAAPFPLSAGLRHPELGIAGRSHRVIEVQGFRKADVEKLREQRPDLAIVYDTTWDPFGLFTRGPLREWLGRLYGYEPSLSPEDAAQALQMRVLHQWEERGLMMSLLARTEIKKAGSAREPAF
jgi:hypothetical protein